jgi:proline iminopeptidase
VKRFGLGRILIVAAVVVAVLIAAGLYVWDALQAPLYQPGMVRAERNLRAPLQPPATQPTGAFWQVENDVQLYHFSDGSGPNILVVHGGPGVPFDASPPGLHALGDRYRLVYYDQRGCGRSTRPLDRFASSNYYENVQTLDRTLGLGAQVADIERIRRLLGDEQLILVGHSWGGFLATLYAAEFPEHVRALVLVAPAEMLVMPAPDGGLYEQVRRLLPEAQQADYAGYQQRLFDYRNLFARSDAELTALNAEFVPYYAAAAQARGFAVPAVTPGTNGGWAVQAQYFSIGMRHDYRAALAAIRAPVLVVHGGNDIQPEAASRAYADAIPGAQFIAVPGAGHFVFDDQPEAFAQALGAFLAQLPSAP